MESTAAKEWLAGCVQEGEIERIPKEDFMRILTVLSTAILLASPALAEETAPVITVTGEGTVAAVPDMATVSLGVTTNGDTARAALDANSAALAAVIARLKASGVAATDIQTSGLSLGPVFDYAASSSGGAPKPTGFQASNMVTVEVHALDALGTMLDAAVGDGANTLNGIFFGLEDSAPKADEARLKAMADARRKAELLAEAAGARLGAIVAIGEGGAVVPYAGFGGAAFDRAASAVPVASGELAVSATLSVTWELAPQ